MVKSYCNYGIYNENTALSLEVGDSVDTLTYWKANSRATLIDVRVINITKYEIIVETEDFDEIEIPIKKIEDWR